MISNEAPNHLVYNIVKQTDAVILDGLTREERLNFIDFVLKKRQKKLPNLHNKRVRIGFYFSSDYSL